MTGFTLFFAILGACYVSYLIMKFIVWLDNTDEPEEDARIETEHVPAPARAERHRNAA